jgi:hypothetical protein
MSTSVAWEHELQPWLEPFLKPLHHPAIRRLLLDHLAHAMRLRCPICRSRFTLGSLMKMPK